MKRLIMMLMILVLLPSCGTDNSATTPNQLPAIKPAPTIKVTNITPNNGTGHRDGQELYLIGFTVENPDFQHQILRNISYTLYDPSNIAVDYFSSLNAGTVDFGLLPGESLIKIQFNAVILKALAHGVYTLKVYAIDANGIKTDVVITTIPL